MAEQQRWLDAPLIVHKCPNCQRLFDSPSVCMDDGSETEEIVRPIKLVIWKDRPKGQPKGVGYADEDADAHIVVDFHTGSATVFPAFRGPGASSGPPRTAGLEIVVVTEHDPPASGQSPKEPWSLKDVKWWR